MQNLEVFFINHFDSDRLSDDNVRKFTEDHLQRLAAMGSYHALSVAMEAAYVAYFGAITDEATKIAIREGQTMAVNQAVEAIKKAVSQQEGTVRGKFGKDSPVYQEFFPGGVTEYSQATLANIEEKVVRLINAATAHAAALPGMATLFTDLLDTFTTARDAQLGSKGLVATGKVASSSSRDVVETQLMTDLLTIALDHIGDPDGGLAYFDQSILQGSSTPPKPPTPPGP